MRLVKTMLESLKHKVLSVTIALGALIVLSETARAQENGYPALDLMVEAGQSYQNGLAECDATAIGQAGDAYLEIRRTLLNDPGGLARQYQKLLPKTAYMIGWCYLRRAEILATPDLMDLARTYFDSVATDAPDFLGGYAAIMTGDILLRQAVEEKYRLLCEGKLDSAQIERVVKQISAAGADFSDAGRLIDKEAYQQNLVYIKSEDVLYELARLYSSVGDSAKALAYLDSIDYSPQKYSGVAGSGLTNLGHYYEAVITFEHLLLAPADPTARANVSSKVNRFNQFDQPYRLAVIERMNGEFSAPIKKFENAGRLNTQSGNLPLPEAYYFLGFTHLGLATDEDSLRSINSTPARVLALAKADFDQYVDALGTLKLNHDERLQYLLTRAEHKSLVLSFALGESLSDNELVSLSSDDVKFLIRIAASTHTLARRRCIKALNRFFHAYLPRLQAGTLDINQNNASGEGCSTVSAVRFTAEQALFYKGILQSLEAEGQIGQEAALTFETAATTMAQVTGDFAAEAAYVRARSLCRARKYNEAIPLLRHLVQKYGSVRALYWYAMAYRGTHPLQNAEDTTAIKDELHGLMLAVREAIRSAGDPPEYDNFRVNAQVMLKTSLAGHFRSSDSLSIDGIDQLNCPETLSVDISGLTPELVMYETLSEKAAIGEQFAEESRRDIVGYGLPKLWLAPGEQYCGNSAIPTIGNSFVPVPDSVYIEYIWRGRIQFVDKDDNTLVLDQCYTELKKDGSSINCVDSTKSHGAYFFDADIDMHDKVIIRATKEGFYLTTIQRTSHQPGDAFFTERLARQVGYTGSTNTDQGPFDLTHNSDDSYSYNITAIPKVNNPPAVLIDHFTKDRFLRDYAFDSKKDRYLAVSSKMNNSLVVYSNNGNTDTLTINSHLPLNSAEGIAVDNDGNIYIADWGNHRVLVLNSQGNERFSFGAVGQNRTENSGEPARLLFPNRILIEQDSKSAKHPRQMHILVSDWLGVHKFDPAGRYLDSPVRAGQGGLGAGSAYGIALDGYGPGSILRVHDLTTSQPHVFTAKK